MRVLRNTSGKHRDVAGELCQLLTVTRFNCQSPCLFLALIPGVPLLDDSLNLKLTMGRLLCVRSDDALHVAHQAHKITHGLIYIFTRKISQVPIEWVKAHNLLKMR